MTPEVKQRIEQIRSGEVPEGYKKTALGIVPANWIETTLGKIYTERNEPGNDSLPLLMVSIHSGVSDGEVAEEGLPKKIKRIEDKSQYKHAMPGDLVFNMMRAWQGAIGSVRTEGMVSPAYIVAKPNDMADPIFMDYYMKTPRMVNMIHRQSYGVTDFRLRLYWDSFSPIPCVLPPIEEQKRIAEILSVQDTLISLQRKKVAAYQQLKKSFLAKLLLKGGSNGPELRFKGFSDAWEQHKLGEVGKARSGVGFPDEEQGGTSGTPFFKVSDMNNDGNENEMTMANNYVTEAQIAARRWSPIEELPAIFFAKVGAAVMLNRKRLCRFPFLLDNNSMAYSLDRDRWDADFAKALFETLDLTSLVQVGALPSYNTGDVEAMEIMLPKVPEQHQIGAFFKQLDTFITLHQRKVDFTQTEKDVLMQLLLTGLVSVKRRNHGLLI